MRKYLAEISLVILVIFINFVIGCTYYKVTHADSIAPVTSSIQHNTRYFIVHQGSNSWHLNNIKLDSEKEELTGSLEVLPENHTTYLTTKPEGPNRIKTKPSSWANPNQPNDNPTYEVHFYISEYLEQDSNHVTIPLASITKIEMYDSDVGANNASAVFTILGVVAGIVVVAGIIVALTKSSCPFVYVRDSTSFDFAGEMYGGAIYSSLERNDYMPLPGCKTSSGRYQLKICNKLLERQYTNLAELIIVEHPDSARVLLDKKGHIQTLLNPESPATALSDKHIDYTSSIQSKDSSTYFFNDENMINKDRSNLILTFKKPVQASTGKLVVSAKNSYWLDYVYGKFNEQFGIYFNTFSEAQKNVPAEKINQWSLEQGIPLSVYIETQNGWKFVDYFNVIGPLASREMVMSLDLSNIKGEEVKIKLECGFMFWELDYAAMDFSPDIPVTVSHLPATTAIDEKGKEVSSSLAVVDNDYLVQPEVGNEVTLTYDFHLPTKHTVQSVFLHSSGYYEYIREYKNMPDLIALSSFKKKGAFAKFSKKQYYEFVSKPYSFDDAISANDGN